MGNAGVDPRGGGLQLQHPAQAKEKKEALANAGAAIAETSAEIGAVLKEVLVKHGVSV